MVRSSGMSQEFQHLTYFNSITVVFKCAEGREFRHSSGVPTPHNDTVTGRVRYGNGYKTASFSRGL